MIHGDDRCDFNRSAGEEYFVRNVKLTAADGTLDNFQLHFIARQFDNAGTRDAFQNIVGGWRRD